MREILVKHSGSSANDAVVSYSIDRQSKVVRVSMTDRAGRPFFSSSHLLHLVLGPLVREAEIDVVVDDSASWHPQRSEWTVLVAVGVVEYRARFNKLILGSEVCIELWP